MNKIQFMAMSLPYNLKYLDSELEPTDNIVELIGLDIYNNSIFDEYGNTDCTFEEAKPILRPISDISNTCLLGNIRPINQFSRVDKPKILECGNDYEAIQCLSFYIVELLVKWHFDIAGLIEKGEAVDYHTLEGFVF